LQVHPSYTEINNTLVNGLIVKFPEIKNLHDESAGSEARPGIVHRLDKDTSGVMIVARNQKTFLALKKKFKKREVEKKYLAVVHGNLKERIDKIEAPIARAASFKRQKVAKGRIKGTAKEAVTEYKVLKRFEKFDFVEVTPRTGRMHQIRVHFSYSGHPLVGDRKYARKDLKNPGMVKRHILHAKQIKFELFGRKYFLEAPLARDFFQFLKLLDDNEIKS
jgi:23S rRNA pseudouridine1911/1915/1917 synthase